MMVRLGAAWRVGVSVLLAGWVWSGCAWAQHDDLYAVDRVVDDATAPVRRQAIAQMAVEVARRLAGPLTDQQRSALRAASDQAVDWVQRFSYATDTAGAANATDAATVLKLRFDPAVMNQALADLGIAVWRGARPQTLVWLAVDDGERRYVVSSESDEAMARALRAEARRQGVALRFPLMDLAERRQVKAGDVWGGFHEPLLQASRRYDAASVLIGRVRRRGAVATARWTHRLGAADAVSATADGDLPTVADALVSTVFERLVQAFRPLSGETSTPESVRFTVTDIHDLAAYAAVLRYLQGLGGIERLQVLRADGHSIEFAAAVAGGMDGLRRVARFGRRLQPPPQGATFRYLP